jgi:deoxyhypusine synthase
MLNSLEGFNRYYDVYGDEADYLQMTELIAEFILTLDEDYKYSSREFLSLFGNWLGKQHQEHSHSGC